MLPAGDAELVQIVDAALADAAARSGDWLFCHPGCTPCCHGVFRIDALDAERLRAGLRAADPGTAQRIRERVSQSIEELAFDFPGDPATGLLSEDEDSLQAFEHFANEARCPVLDPATGTCDLYAHRPMTCRTFGPPVRTEDGIGICELCFVGAPESAVQAAEMKLPPPELEAALLEQTGLRGETIIAFALQGC
jgi:Fe-S-cluster containining protein